MDILWLGGVGLGLIAIVFGTPVLTFIGKKLIGMDFQKGLNQGGLQLQVVTLSNGFKAHYFERKPKGETNEPTLVVLPGANVDMHFMGARMSGLFTQLPDRHIVVLELPHHGLNVTSDLNFEATAESTIAMAEYLEDVRQAMDLDQAFDLIGYSLGGGIATEYAVLYPQQINRLILLAPYFYELATDAFVEAIDADRLQNIHGWETMDQMKNFFHHWLGLAPADAPPAFIMRGINALRADAYPSGYWRACLRCIHQHSTHSNTILANRTEKLAALRRSILVITASDDAICDPKKLRQLEGAFGSQYCTMREVSSGHTFGTDGATLFDIASDDMQQFLTDSMDTPAG